MLKIHEIREIIKLLDQSSLQEFEMEGDGVRLSIKKGGQAAAPAYQQQNLAQPAAVAPEPVIQQAAPVAVSAPVSEPVAPRIEEKAQPARVAEDANLHKIVSPMVGTFYSKPDPNSPIYVKPGDKVKQDTVVCIVEAMKLFNEIEAEVSGEIVKVLVKDGQLVEYGQPLFLVKPE